MRMRAAIETRITHFFLSFLSSALFLFPFLGWPQNARTRRTFEGVGVRVRAQEFVMERRSSKKHPCLPPLIRRRLSSPRGNVLVERRSRIKHIQHIRHLRCVPIPNVLVKRRSFIKHHSHTRHLRCVPIPNVLVER